MKTELNRKEAEERINEFFLHIKEKSPEQVRKIKRLAMHYHLRLGEKRKLFCKYCFSNKLKVKRIKKGMKSVECGGCKRIMRFSIR